MATIRRIAITIVILIVFLLSFGSAANKDKDIHRAGRCAKSYAKAVYVDNYRVCSQSRNPSSLEIKWSPSSGVTTQEVLSIRKWHATVNHAPDPHAVVSSKTSGKTASRLIMRDLQENTQYYVYLYSIDAGGCYTAAVPQPLPVRTPHKLWTSGRTRVAFKVKNAVETCTGAEAGGTEAALGRKKSSYHLSSFHGASSSNEADRSRAGDTDAVDQKTGSADSVRTGTTALKYNTLTTKTTAPIITESQKQSNIRKTNRVATSGAINLKLATSTPSDSSLRNALFRITRRGEIRPAPVIALTSPVPTSEPVAQRQNVSVEETTNTTQDGQLKIGPVQQSEERRAKGKGLLFWVIVCTVAGFGLMGLLTALAVATNRGKVSKDYSVSKENKLSEKGKPDKGTKKCKTEESAPSKAADITIKVTADQADTPENDYTPPPFLDCRPSPGVSTQVTSSPEEINQMTSRPGDSNQMTPRPGDSNQMTPRPGDPSWTGAHTAAQGRHGGDHHANRGDAGCGLVHESLKSHIIPDTSRIASIISWGSEFDLLDEREETIQSNVPITPAAAQNDDPVYGNIENPYGNLSTTSTLARDASTSRSPPSSSLSIAETSSSSSQLTFTRKQDLEHRLMSVLGLNRY